MNLPKSIFVHRHHSPMPNHSEDVPLYPKTFCFNCILLYSHTIHSPSEWRELAIQVKFKLQENKVKTGGSTEELYAHHRNCVPFLSLLTHIIILQTFHGVKTIFEWNVFWDVWVPCKNNKAIHGRHVMLFTCNWPLSSHPDQDHQCPKKARRRNRILNQRIHLAHLLSSTSNLFSHSIFLDPEIFDFVPWLFFLDLFGFSELPATVLLGPDYNPLGNILKICCDLEILSRK